MSDMYSRAARLATFERAHQPSKKRSSTQGKKKAGAVEWPHERPRPADLARAGFFYRPELAEDEDNVQCFFCSVKLNGWEPEDDPLQEHLAHKSDCAWAMAMSVSRNEGEEEEMRDPQCTELLEARKATFGTIMTWPHEKKKGWKCKTNKMAEAGWSFDPSPECEDGAVCHYCGTELDGWEPKDDPFTEHQKRRADCRFFTLMVHHHGTEKPKRSRSKATSKARSSVASKASRISMQSTASSAFHDQVGDFITEPSTLQDDSAHHESAQPSKAKKAKSTKGRKKASDVASEIGEMQSQITVDDNQEMDVGAKNAKPSKSKGRKAASKSTADDQADDAVPKKRGRPAKSTSSKQSAAREASQASHQLLGELESSMIDELSDDAPARSSIESQAQRGTKRSSDGTVKPIDDLAAFPLPPSMPQKGKKKSKTGHKSSTASNTSQVSFADTTPFVMSSAEQNALDEEEIDAELARIEAEQRQMSNATTSREPPMHLKHDEMIHVLQDDEESENWIAHPSSPIVSSPDVQKIYVSPSPSGSDKENISSTSTRKSIVSPEQRRPLLAQTTPVKATTHDAGTMSPKKQLGFLTSSKPWTAIDLDSVVLASSQPTPGKLRDQLMTVSGVLTAEEKRMSLEAWIRWRAEHNENELRRKCEEMVTVFEREGNRALDCLHNLAVTA